MCIELLGNVSMDNLNKMPQMYETCQDNKNMHVSTGSQQILFQFQGFSVL